MLACTLSYCDVKNPGQARTRIVYGGDHNYPPFQYLDKDGRPAGFNIEVMEAVAEEAGWDVEFRLEPWERALKEFKEGRIDITDMFFSGEQKPYADFTQPFTILYHLVFIRQKDNIRISSIEELKNIRVIVQKDSYAHDALLKMMKRENIIPVDTEHDAILLLSSGKGDCALVSRVGGYVTIDEHNLSGIIAACPPLLPVQYCFAVRKGNASIFNQLSSGLNDIRIRGKYEEIDRKWLQRYRTAPPTVGEAVRRIGWILAVLILFSGAVMLWLFSLRRVVANQTGQLREDIGKIRADEERIAHLNRILRAIRNINQLIIREKDLCHPIRNTCRLLVEPEGYRTSLIVLLDRNGIPAQYCQEGFGKEFRSMEESLKHGRLPPCYEKCLSPSGVHFIADRSSECGGCPLAELYSAKNSMCAKMEYEGNILGFIAVSFEIENVNEQEEKLLLAEVAGDIAYAIHGIRSEEAKSRSEEALKKSREQYRTLFDETKDLICICSPEGRLLDINTAAMQTFGYASKEEIFKLDMAKNILWNPEDIQRLTDLMERDGFIKDYEVEMQDRSGDKLVVRITATVSRNKEGKIMHYWIIGRDITEQKRIGQQMIQTEKMAALGELVSGVAHEINNPLTAMLGFTELLLKTHESMDEEMRQDVQKIYDAAMRVYGITTGLLRFGRMEKPMKKKEEINALLEETLALKEYHLRIKNIKVVKNLQSGLPFVNADAKQMEQVFLNIMNNAEYAMSEKENGGTLTIRTSPVGRWIKIQIIDTGPGIPEEHIRKIFDPFFTTKPADKGTGLGLSVSYGIIKEHGGEIYVENRREGGALFVILLPAGEDDGK